MRILLVEDQQQIAADVRTALQAAGYLVDHSADGEDGWFRGDTEDYDLIVLDLGLPQLDGLTILKRWRAGGMTAPVLVLTARGAWTERVEGIDSGADDYLPKPFQMDELVARVRALIRRAAGHGAAVVEAGPLTLDTRQMRLSVNGVARSLTPLEYRLMAYLILHKGRLFRRRSSWSISMVTTTPGRPTHLRQWSPGCARNLVRQSSKPDGASVT